MQPTKQRNHAGVLLQYKTENLLFDCGEAIQRQMRITGIKPAKVTRLFISHWHGDHVFGIPGLMSSMGADQYAKKLQIYGPKGTKKYLDHMFKSFAAKDIIPYEAHEVSSGIICETDDFVVISEPLKHSVPCIGFQFREKDTLRINMSKAKKYGLKEGPVVGKLLQGKNVVVDGVKLNAKDVTYLVEGKRVSYVTDTMDCTGARKLAQDVDLLIMEGTLLDNLKKNALKSKHLTVKQTALIASEENAKKLVITHISQRYKSSADLASEAREYFDDVVIAEDFLKIMV
jgi:ribonuclease Z